MPLVLLRGEELFAGRCVLSTVAKEMVMSRILLLWHDRGLQEYKMRGDPSRNDKQKVEESSFKIQIAYAKAMQCIHIPEIKYPKIHDRS